MANIYKVKRKGKKDKKKQLRIATNQPESNLIYHMVKTLSITYTQGKDPANWCKHTITACDKPI